MSNLFSIILKTFIIGPIIGTSYYSNKSNRILINCIIIAIIDAILYGTGLYLSIETIDELHDQRNEDFQSIIKQQKQSNNEVMDVLIRTQIDLYDLIKDLVQNNTSDQQNSLNKLNTLEFVQKDSIMTIKNNINENLQLFHTNFNQSILSDSFLFDRINFYICTSSLLLYIQQIILWFLQYLTLQNPKQYLIYSFILSAIILSQSLGFIYFLQITSTSSFPSALYIYTFIFFLRSLISLYHQALGDDLF
jgi:hypothetical protein